MTENSNKALTLLAGITVVLAGTVGNAFAQDKELHPDVLQFEEVRDLGSLSCRDILLASGAARENLVLVLHAYLLGEAKQLEFNAIELAEGTDRFLHACIAKPDAQALQTMRNEVG